MFDHDYAFDEIKRKLARAAPVPALEPAPNTLQADPLDALPTTVSRLNQAELIATAQEPGHWHNAMLTLTARMATSGADRDAVLALAPQVQQAGFSLEQTAQDLAVMFDGAARKYAANTSPLTGQLRGSFKRDMHGHIRACLENVVLALKTPGPTGYALQFDTFRAEGMIAQPGADTWRPLTDADGVSLRMALEGLGFKPVSKDMMRDAIVKTLADQRVDTAIDWLNAVPPWDGIPRIEQSLVRYFKAADTPYSAAVGNYLWTSAAGRILDPGCKADMVIVAVGKQGVRKSTAVAAIAPNPMFFAEASLSDRDADLSRKLRGKMVIELAELRGLKSRESEAIKAWISTTHERWVPKYQEFETAFPRRCIMIGTSNDNEFLGDPTGERRWLPVAVLDTIDVEGLIADRDQLWAEARVRWSADGVLWSKAEELATSEHQHFTETDVWAEPTAQWLFTAVKGGVCPADRPRLTTMDALSNLDFELTFAKVGRRETFRMGRVLKSLGMRSTTRYLNGMTVRTWVRDNDMEP